MLGAVSISPSTVSFAITIILLIVAVVVGYILVHSGVMSRQLGVDATSFAEAQTTMQRQQIDISHLQEQNQAKDVSISKLEAKVEMLQTMVTARDLIEELEFKMVRGFMALGVDQNQLMGRRATD